MATPTADSIGLTGNAFIDGLTQGGSWVFNGPRVLTYSLNINFSIDAGGGFVPGPGGNWNPPLADAFARALGTWSNVANIGFQLTNSGTYFFQSSADIAATVTGDNLTRVFGVVGLGVFPDADAGNALLTSLGVTRMDYPRPEGDVFFDNYYPGFSYLNEGGFGFESMVHEIGHSLGLKHPSDGGLNDRPTFASLGIAQYDADRYTVMTTGDSSGSLSAGNVATPMPLDILAIQQIYGANMSFHAGNDTYQVGHPGFPTPLTTVWDAGGVDTFDASNSVIVGFTIDLRPGAMTNTTAIAYNVTIENAVGTAGNDMIIGNDANNSLDPRSGFDTLKGGLGNDIYTIRGEGQVIIEDPGEGTDTMLVEAHVASFGPIVSLQTNVENLSLTGSGPFAGVGAQGNELDNVLTGNSEANALSGLSGDDKLVGGAGNDRLDGGSGNDYLDGGDGIDTADFASAGAAVTVNLNTGIVSGGAGSDIALGFENLRGSAYDDALTANALNNSIEGAGGNDYIAGGAGNDRIDGGPGADYLDGGADSDMLDYASAGAGVMVNLNSGTAGGGAGSDTVIGFEDLQGSGFDDALTGNALANYIAAGAGNDRLDGGLGDDYLDGGAGIDRLDYASAGAPVTVNLNTGAASGGAGSDTVVGFEDVQGTTFDDAFTGSALNNSMTGAAGNDYIAAGAGNDRLDGGSGADYLDGGADSDTLEYASAGAGVAVNLDTGVVSGGAGNDTVLGFEDLLASGFDDVLIGNALNNYIAAGAGNDRVDGGPGADYLDGGAGTDTLDYASAGAGVTVNLNTGNASGGAGSDKVAGFEYLLGSGFDDALHGDALNNSMVGGAGNDYIAGGAGNDRVESGSGADYLDGGADSDMLDYSSASAGVTVNLITGTATDGAGNDTVVGFEDLRGSAFDDVITGNNLANYITAGSGNDSVDGFLGDDYVDGGDGTDTVVYTSAGFFVAVNLGAGTASGGAGSDTLVGFEDLLGSIYDDALTGNAFNNSIGGAAGNDYIAGGAGNDRIDGGSGADYLDGGADSDMLDYSSAGGGVTVNLNTGTANGGAGNDTVVGFEDLQGSGFDDALNGNALNNYIAGGAGNDYLGGGFGDDYMDAGAGDDYLAGGVGHDFLVGSAGQDTFVTRLGDGSNSLSLTDVITDYQDGADSIGLAGGLTFADLVISPGLGAHANDLTLIQAAASGEYLAILLNINVTSLDMFDFKTVT